MNENSMTKGEVKGGNSFVGRATRVALVTVGTVCVVLGAIGVFVPVLPTTPFLLLAAFCFARSSDRFHSWLLNNRWCGEYIRNYREGRGVPLKQKILTLILLWGTMSYAIGFVVSSLWARSILLAIAVAVTLHLVIMKTRRAAVPRSGPTGHTTPLGKPD
jgi:hypothetical protein